MIKLVVFDFDGVFTDGKILFDNEGNTIKHYNTKDGAGIFKLYEMGYEVGVISGWTNNNSQSKILNHLNIKRVSFETNNKLETLNNWCKELNITLENVAYIGDDLNDIKVMKEVKLVGCPNDAIDEVKEISDFICKKNGGNGAVREFCEYILENIIKISGLICVKYESTRLPLKNFRKFGNSTLLDIKINKLLKLYFLDEVIINTESEFIINYIKENYDHKKIKIVKRDNIFASDYTDNREFCINVATNVKNDYILYSPVTMPFIETDTYSEMYLKIKENKYDSIILAADGKQGKGHKYENHKLCFGASLMKKIDIINYGDFIGKTPYFIQTKNKERIDIDYPEEFNIALYHYFNKDSIYGSENKHSLDINTIYKIDEFSNIGNNKEIKNYSKNVEIIDVTIRDGGFNNKWKWEYETIKDMLTCASDTGIQYFEIGYICNANVLDKNDGHYRNVSFETIDTIVNDTKAKCKISVLFDSWRYDTNQLPYKKYTKVDLIRVVTYIEDDKLLQAIEQCKNVKNKGYNVSLNIMCASYFNETNLKNIKKRVLENINILDFLYFADSYGAMEPKDVCYIFTFISDIKKYNPNIKLGFHIHNNGQIGMANMIESLEYVDIIDASYYGMGRGMGNVRLEDVILFLIIKKKYNLNIEYFLNYLEKNVDSKTKDEIKNTILGFLNIHPYRIKDYKEDISLYTMYTYLKELPFDKKYDYLKE
jgi:3-deoxy-D-manno-octulosonate 8-phosphate phosphatase (KDO 8-P phosphatase)